MDTKFRKKIENKYVKRDPDIKSGDTVKVHLKIVEAGKERTQIFEGVVLSVKGTGLSRTITVRKISHGVGVEKILPINSPLIQKIDVENRGKTRRAKLYFMRDRIGKRSLEVQMDEEFRAIYEYDKDQEQEQEGIDDGKDNNTGNKKEKTKKVQVKKDKKVSKEKTTVKKKQSADKEDDDSKKDKKK